MAAERGVCREPPDFYLVAVGLRSFFWVLGTHLLAGAVDTSLPAAPLGRQLWWWLRYYNPLNLSWRYYSMVAYRCAARRWGKPQLALINHEEHPFSPPVPYIVGETVHPPPRVRRIEMAGFLSSQGILSVSAFYEGALAIQYAISTAGIPYLPNATAPLAMVGLFRVMAWKYVATKIHVDNYPYPVMSSSPSKEPNAGTLSLSTQGRDSYASAVDHTPSLSKSSIASEESPPPAELLSPQSYSPSALQLTNQTVLPILYRPYSMPLARPPLAVSPTPVPLAPTCETAGLPIHTSQTRTPSSSEAVLPAPSSDFQSANSILCSAPSSTAACSTTSLPSSGFTTPRQYPDSPRSSDGHSTGGETDTHELPHLTRHPSSNTWSYKFRFIFGVWHVVLLGLVAMAFLPYKVRAAYFHLPRTLLQASMQIFYEYIAVTELVFHGCLLYRGPRALANRVPFFDHWTFKVQTVGFYCLLSFMLVVALLDFIEHDFYRACA